jgi:peroxiredoxin Q/BCP
MTIEIDSKVPDFTATSTAGEFNLSDHIGKRVVMYFYPKDNTPGCTTESEGFRDHFKAFSKLNTVIVGISRDSPKSHASFKAKLEAPFDLISDPDEAVCTLFDVMKMKNMYGKQVRGVERSTFVIDEKGVLRKQWRGVKVPGHVNEVLEYVQSLA